MVITVIKARTLIQILEPIKTRGVLENKVRRAYNLATYLEQRIELMVWWGNFDEPCKQNFSSM